MLAVIKNEQKSLALEICNESLEQRTVRNFLHAKIRGDRRHHQGGLVYWRELDKANAAFRWIAQRRYGLQGGLRLSNAAGSGDRDQAILAQKRGDLAEL